MKKHLFILTIAGLFFSCQREEANAPFATDTDISVLPNTETKASNDGLLGWVALTGQTHISAEEAQETALATAMQMREVEGIVTKAPLKIGSIEVVKGDTRKPYVPTKGNAKPEQADVYIVNFANNQGYVITSADRRVPSVLAYNSYGHLGDTISNPGQAILFSYMQAYIEEQREAFEANKEKLVTKAEEAIFKQLSKEQQAELIAEGYFDENGKKIKSKGKRPRRICYFDSIEDPGDGQERRIVYGEWETKEVKAPLIKTLWGQNGSYNDALPLYCESRTDEPPVGCTAVAIGQLLAYHKKPDSIVGRKMHWDDMTKVDARDMFSSIYSYDVWDNPIAKGDIQHLLAHLGDRNLLYMDYGCKESGSSREFGTLHSLGYTEIKKEKYNDVQVISELKNNRPLLIDGCAIKTDHKIDLLITKIEWPTYDKCHAWLLDGYVRRERIITTQIDCNYGEDSVREQYTEKIELVHNNFGWGDSYNKTKYGVLGLDGSYAQGTGWYHIGIFNAKGSKENSNSYKSSGELFNYRFQLGLISNIK
ncbi:C10 family peptidase [Capnocytophaga genosp. AHN8471]|uniref:C10 family peptidase n=1 Tax=Capnocytophaga genosp. AHN8471 TaxID=327574 RepID=A0ABS1YUF7_9FLAO|nr:C10 family peptidase [Capnocytophaga genosp. AHN8471]MBM0650016.1 C10 family peptidase [Capnocytophaga genosp. AHN8471]MBM0660757.1 C10 family peptidase [Capnocytophaga genosp. AHN8471]